MERATIERRTALRAALATAAALLVGGGTAPASRAKVMRAHGSIAHRVTNQRDICEIDGGTLQTTTFTQPPRPPGQQTTQTVCNGGKSDGYTCTNTPKYTSCGYYDIRGPEDDGPAVDDPAEDLASGGFTAASDSDDAGASDTTGRPKRRRAKGGRR